MKTTTPDPTMLAPAIFSAIPNCKRSVRLAYQLSAAPPALQSPVGPELDDLLPYIPADILQSATVVDPNSITRDTRDWLTCNPKPVVGKYGSGTLDYGSPPVGLSLCEGVLWCQLGRACARALQFLSIWLSIRRHKIAAERCGISNNWVALARAASPIYDAMYAAVQAVIERGRAAEIEECMSDLATGKIERVRTVTDASGKVTTTSDGAIYDVKAASLLLPGYRPETFGQRQSSGGGVSISIQVAIPAPAMSKRADNLPGGDQIIDVEPVSLAPIPLDSDNVSV